MVREDNTASGPKKQKSAGLGPATLDLSATEVASESPEASTEASQMPAEPVTPSAGNEAPWGAPASAETTKADEAAAVASEGRPLEEERLVEEERLGERPAAPEIPAQPKLDVFDQPPQSRSSLPLVLAALLGGVVGGALVLAAGIFNLLPLGKSSDDGLTPRLVAAEQDIASNKSAIDQALSKVGSIEVTAKTAQDAANSALSLAGDAQKAAAAAATAAPPGPAPSEQAPPAPAPDLTPLTDRLTKAEADIAALHTTADQAGAEEATVTQLQNDLQDTRKQLAALQASASATPDKAAAFAVALSQLGDAIRGGKPFSAELKTATALGGGDALAPLAGFADSGTPSIEALATGFDALKPQLVAALTPKPAAPPPDAGVMDRLMSSLSHVVTVTHEGGGSPDDPTGPVQKVADALHRGDLAGAVTAFKAMPDPAQQAGAAWLTQASGVLGALDLIKAQTSAALQKFSGQ